MSTAVRLEWPEGAVRPDVRPEPEPLDAQTVAQIFGIAEDGSAALAWMDGARCAEVAFDLHFPEKGESTREAKRVCSNCEVRAECLEYALEHNERWGIWGGLSEQERRRLSREAA